MKKSIWIVLSTLGVLLLWFVACEEPMDPFSDDKAPEIRKFGFTGEGAIFTGKETFDINLSYEDKEQERLYATFQFLKGSGRISHSAFTEKQRSNKSITFEVPGKLNSERNDPAVKFIPDGIGEVEIFLTLSDKLRKANSSAQCIFVDGLAIIKVTPDSASYGEERDVEIVKASKEVELKLTLDNKALPIKSLTFSHTFTEPKGKKDPYVFILTATDRKIGLTDKYAINVYAYNTPPKADFINSEGDTILVVGNVPQPVDFFSLSKANDKGDSIKRARWTFDDNTVMEGDTVQKRITVPADSLYTVKLEAWDQWGEPYGGYDDTTMTFPVKWKPRSD